MISIHITDTSSPQEMDQALAAIELLRAFSPVVPPVEPIHPPPPVISPAEAPTSIEAPVKRSPGRPRKTAAPVEDAPTPTPSAATINVPANAELEDLLSEYEGVLRAGGVSEEKIAIAVQSHRETPNLAELRTGIEESKAIVAKRNGAAPVQEKIYSPDELRAALNALNEREGFEVALAFLQNDMQCKNIAALASRPASDQARFMARCAGKGE